MRRPSGEVVAPAEQCAGEQAWYSDSDKLKHHEGISTFSIGALILAEKLDSTKVLSSISRPPVVVFVIDECLISADAVDAEEEKPVRLVDGTMAAHRRVRDRGVAALI